MKKIDILSLFYPNTCCFCGKVSEKNVCGECEKKIVYIQEPRCKKCGKPVRYEEEEYCYDCSRREFFYEQGRSIWLHKEPVTWSIYQFKYHNRRIYGEFYARELWRLYGKNIREWKITRIVPVPIHRGRRRKRGYNQAQIIAKKLGKLANLPVESGAVVRIRQTGPQKKLDHRERRKNLKGAFEQRKEWDSPQRILLIDDIYTTGSTIDEIARLFCEKSHHKVWFLTISIGQDF